MNQSQLIFHEDHENKILVESSIENKDQQVSDFVFKITQSILEKEGMDLIVYFGNRGRFVDFIHETALWSTYIFEKISSKLTFDELRTTFLRKSSSGGTILHCLARHKNKKRKSTVWNLIVEIINDVQMLKTLLLEENLRQKMNFFYLAASFDEEILIQVLDWYKINFCFEDFKSIFLEQKHENNYTLLCME